MFRLQERFVPKFIELVAQPGCEFGLADGPSDSVGIESVVGPGGGDHVLFDHDRSHVVGSTMKCDLCRLLSDCEPRGLDVGNVVQDDPAYGDDAQVFGRRKGRGDTLFFQLGARAAEYPRNKGKKTILVGRFLCLQVTDADQMLDPLAGCFYVAVHHCGGGGQSQTVGDAHHFDPLIGIGFSRGESAAHVVVEDFGSCSGQRVESCVDQASECGFDVQSADAGDVVHLGGSQRMQPDLRIASFQLPEKVLIERNA